MKRISMTLMAGAMAALAGPAMAESMSLTRFKPHVMPVLVQVNAKGRVTEVLPSTELPPKLQRLLTENLNGWITRPAMVKGHAVGSQMIVNVALRATPRKDGNYAVNFAYVSRQPSPFGMAAHWVWKDGDQLALVSNSGMGMQRRMQQYQNMSPPSMNNWRPKVAESMRPVSQPASRSATQPSAPPHR